MCYRKMVKQPAWIETEYPLIHEITGTGTGEYPNTDVNSMFDAWIVYKHWIE